MGPQRASDLPASKRAFEQDNHPLLPRNWVATLWQIARPHALLSIVVALASALGSIFYVTQFCVPLYSVDASIDVQNGAHDYYLETLAQVLDSNSLIKSALERLSDAQRQSLLRQPNLTLWSGARPQARLRRNLTTQIIPAANVIEIKLLSPDRAAGVAFLNALVQQLKDQNRQQADNELLYGFESGRHTKVEVISTIDPAYAATRPSWPNTPLDVSLAVLCGIAASFLFVLIRYFASRTIMGPASVAKVLKVRLLGVLPKQAEDATAALPNADDEWIRYLRSSVLYSRVQRPLRSLAFTSVDSGDPGAQVVLKLGISLASSGRRVLLIDGNLRRPSLHPLLEVPSGFGLADLLRADSDSAPMALSGYVSPGFGQNLFIMPPGTPGSDVAELLAGKKLPALIRELVHYFDFVLIEAPNLLLHIDARNLSRVVDGVVLVVQSRKTEKRNMRRGRDTMAADGAVLMGAVLTEWGHSSAPSIDPARANCLGV